MRTENLKIWSATPINAQLIEFLIEGTKNARSPISCRRLAEEFYASTHLTNGVKAIKLRIDRIRSKILYLEDIYWKTKVKLLFVLSVPIDKESIQSSINGHFGFDKRSRMLLDRFKLEFQGHGHEKLGHQTSKRQVYVKIHARYLSVFNHFDLLGMPGKASQKFCIS